MLVHKNICHNFVTSAVVLHGRVRSVDLIVHLVSATLNNYSNGLAVTFETWNIPTIQMSLRGSRIPTKYGKNNPAVMSDNKLWGPTNNNVKTRTLVARKNFVVMRHTITGYFLFAGLEGGCTGGVLLPLPAACEGELCFQGVKNGHHILVCHIFGFSFCIARMITWPCKS